MKHLSAPEAVRLRTPVGPMQTVCLAVCAMVMPSQPLADICLPALPPAKTPTSKPANVARAEQVSTHVLRNKLELDFVSYAAWTTAEIV